MKSIGRTLLGLGAVALVGASAEPQFQKLFPRPGVVGEGWVVRNWTDASESPKWPVVWEVDADGILYGTGRYSPGTSGDRWIGTWLLSERQLRRLYSRAGVQVPERWQVRQRRRRPARAARGRPCLRGPGASDHRPEIRVLLLPRRDPRAAHGNGETLLFRNLRIAELE